MTETFLLAYLALELFCLVWSGLLLRSYVFLFSPATIVFAFLDFLSGAV